MSYLKWVALALLLLLSGCASVSLQENLAVPGKSFFPPGAVSKGASGFDAKAVSTLKRAHDQVRGVAESKSEVNAMVEGGPLPSFLVNEQLVKKLVIAAWHATKGDIVPSDSIDKGDVASFGRVLNESFLATKEAKVISSDDAEKPVTKLIQLYLSEYYSGKDGFVDREGSQFKRPEIKNSIGNDVITAVLGIALEALFDSTLQTKVFYTGPADKPEWQTEGKRQPTAVKLNANFGQALSPQGINARELKAIRYLSGLAADQSKVLSGAIFRTVGGADLGIVIAGKFSIGDNDTLAKMLDTTFEIAGKRIAEAVAIRGFSGMQGLAAQRGKEFDASPAARLLLVLDVPQVPQ